MEFDWQKVVELNPRGYVELNDGRTAIHGPVESVEVDDVGLVSIKTKWQAYVTLGPVGMPQGDWQVVPGNPPIVFPPQVSYVIENTPEKGQRVRFGGMNILYLEEMEGLDPSRVKGLVL